MADQILRLKIDERWYAYEWSQLFFANAQMYVITALLYLFNELQRSRKASPALHSHIDNRSEAIASLLLTSTTFKQFSFLEKTDFSVELEILKLDVPRNLAVARVQYQSPGNIDFVGFGKAIEALCKAYQHTLNFIAGAPNRAATRVATEDKKLDQIRKILNMAKEQGGLSDEEIQELAADLLSKHDKTIRNFFEKRKIPREPPALILVPKAE